MSPVPRQSWDVPGRKASPEPTIKWYNLGRRHGQTLLMFLALVVSYILRTNLSVAIVAMTTTPPENPNFPVMDWGNSEKSLVLSSFYWGYFILQIPAGILAKNYGPTQLLTFTFFLQGIITALSPVAAIYGGCTTTVIFRILVGLCQSFVYPCVNTHLGKWTVPNERSRLFSFAFGGSQVGAMLILLTGGSIAANSKLGWPTIFYVSAGASLLWAVACFFFGADCPDKHKTISKAERDYINDHLKCNKMNTKDMKVPWGKIVKSVPVWALLAAHMGNNWGYIVLLTLIPTYISHILKFDLTNDGLTSALPYFAMWVAGSVFSVIADWLQENKYISTTASRKMWNSIAHYGESIALIVLAYADTSTTGAIALLVTAVGINSGTFMGYLCNHLDLSPNFAGPLMGLTNCIANICSLLSPLISTRILTDEDDKGQWRIVFVVSAVICIIGNTIFLIFGTSETQPWNEPESEGKSKNKSSEV